MGVGGSWEVESESGTLAFVHVYQVNGLPEVRALHSLGDRGGKGFGS